MTDELMGSLDVSAGKLKPLQAITADDTVGQNVMQYCATGWSDKNSNPDIMMSKLILIDGRLFIPSEDRTAVPKYIHKENVGKVKCISKAAQLVWWPGWSVEVREMARNCSDCTEFC